MGAHSERAKVHVRGHAGSMEKLMEKLAEKLVEKVMPGECHSSWKS